MDVFFVISGYLITMLLLREWSRTGGIDFGQFYLRRGLRLLPPLLFMLVITLPFALTWMRDGMRINVLEALLSVIFYVANWANVWHDQPPDLDAHLVAVDRGAVLPDLAGRAVLRGGPVA